MGQFGGGFMSLLGRSLFCAVFVQQVHGLQGGDLGENYDGVVQGSEMMGVWVGEFVRTKDQAGIGFCSKTDRRQRGGGIGFWGLCVCSKTVGVEVMSFVGICLGCWEYFVM